MIIDVPNDLGISSNWECQLKKSLFFFTTAVGCCGEFSLAATEKPMGWIVPAWEQSWGTMALRSEAREIFRDLNILNQNVSGLMIEESKKSFFSKKKSDQSYENIESSADFGLPPRAGDPWSYSYLLSSPATAKLEICLCNLLVFRLSRPLRWWVKTLAPKRYPKMADGWEKTTFPAKKMPWIEVISAMFGQILLDLLDPSRCQKTEVMTENALCMWHIVITYIVHSKSGGWSRLLCPAHRKAKESWHLPLCFVFQLS